MLSAHFWYGFAIGSGSIFGAVIVVCLVVFARARYRSLS